MLIDGITLTDTGTVTGSKVEEVTTLPTTNLINGRDVVLTATDGANTPGFYTYVNGSWLALGSKAYLDSTYLKLAGGTLSGALTLAADPTNNLHSATKQYVDSGLNSKLNQAGGTLTGALLLAADPLVALGASTKQYTDTKLPLAGGTLTGAVVLSGAPTLDLHPATKLYTDTGLNSKLNLAGGTLTGALTLAADPVSSLQAATKGYVDTVAQGLDPKASCRLATTANITLSGLQTIDGVTTVADDRVLVKNQTTASQNGFYLAKASTWVRTSDADGTPVNELSPGAFTYIEEGTVNGTIHYVLVTSGSIVVGTTSLTFTQMSGGTSFTTSTGLTQAGTVLSVDVTGLSGAGITASANKFTVDVTGLSGTGITNSAGKFTVNSAAINGTGLTVSSNLLNVDVTGLSGTGITNSAGKFALNLAGVAGTGLTVSGNTLVFDKTVVPYDVAGSVTGKATASSSILTFKTPRAFTLAANLAGSTTTALVAATASSVFVINKNGTQVATMTYAAAATTATFSTQVAISFAAGDILTLVAPSSADATLSDVSFALAAVLA